MRKQARHLENEIDLKLVGFSKLGSSQTSYKSSDVEPLLGGDSVFENMQAEIEDLLAKVIIHSQAPNPLRLFAILVNSSE